jgi:hypothetical protein
MFAAPFVFVVACKQPAPEPVAPDDQVPTTAHAEMPRTQDADAPAREATPPSSTSEPQRTMNLPAPLRLRVVKVQVQGSATVLTLAGGSDKGINKDWAGCLVKSQTNDACADGGDVAIIRVNPRDTVVKSTLVRDQILSTPYVKVWPR